MVGINWAPTIGLPTVIFTQDSPSSMDVYVVFDSVFCHLQIALLERVYPNWPQLWDFVAVCIKVYIYI